jgi:hypothetical protein
MSNRTDVMATLSNEWKALTDIHTDLKIRGSIISQLLYQAEMRGEVWKMTEYTGRHLELKYCLVHDVSDAVCHRRGGLPRCSRCLGILE